ncbi:MAG: transaldolase family protein, partial [Gemmatimonadales bacterium]
MKRLEKLHDEGQSIWLDNIDRKMLHNGDLERRIAEDWLTGMTSNPTIFEKALADGTDYDEQLSSADSGSSPSELFE